VFLPGSVEPQCVDEGVRKALAESLQHLHTAAAQLMDATDLDLPAALSEIRGHHVPPGLFGRYYEVVLAIQARRFGDAGALFREIVALAVERPELMLLPLSEQALGADAVRYARLVDLGEDVPVMLTAPEPPQWRAFENHVRTALAMIDVADADLSRELRALVVRIVGAVSAQNAARCFGGASSFMLWGAIFLNAAKYQEPISIVGALVHEVTHQLLFGLSQQEPLVRNSIAEQYSSPLRNDPRPMDGVFHATIVCARMHYAYSRLRRTDTARRDPANVDLIDKYLDDQRLRFNSGCETVLRHGHLTATGERFLDGAQAYMRAAA
jgi:HEXXH motif-containing protein